MHSRLKRQPLLRFQDDLDFQELLAGFELLLPLRKASGLSDETLSTQIFGISMGIVGEVADLLNSAAIFAIKEGVECITTDVINAVTGMRATDEDIAAML